MIFHFSASQITNDPRDIGHSWRKSRKNVSKHTKFELKKKKKKVDQIRLYLNGHKF